MLQQVTCAQQTGLARFELNHELAAAASFSVKKESEKKAAARASAAFSNS
ncbi:hypothetical protein [Paenibacillus sp. GCM10027626]